MIPVFDTETTSFQGGPDGKAHGPNGEILFELRTADPADPWTSLPDPQEPPLDPFAPKRPRPRHRPTDAERMQARKRGKAAKKARRAGRGF